MQVETHHGVYMFEREVTARCLLRKDRERKKWDQYPHFIHQKSSAPCFILCFVMSHHLLTCCVKATLSAILCPNVAWSRVGLHLECVGPSIIPLCKYLHKETSLLPLAKTRESNSLFQCHIQLWTERQKGRETEEKRERRVKEKDSKDRLRERNHKKLIRRIMR